MAEESRDRLRVLYLQLLKTAGRWERVLDVDPGDEEAHRALMQRAVDAGNRRAAVRQFERLCERLRADLGVGPDRQVGGPVRAGDLDGEPWPSYRG